MQLSYVVKGIWTNNYWRRCISRWQPEYSVVLFHNTFHFVYLAPEPEFLEDAVKCTKAMLEGWYNVMLSNDVYVSRKRKRRFPVGIWNIHSHLNCLCNNSYKL